ncbi:MAG: gamma-glutamylcyclotransferase family protein [Acidimicrobiia bacterium]
MYFAYTARIAPDDLVDIAPAATFEFVAHLPESTLSFAIEGNGWNGGLPTVVPEPGSTVWGAVFSIPQREMKVLDRIELAEQRHRVESDAIDRNGRRHRVSLHRAAGIVGSELTPSADYLTRMLAGSRHWELPVGWIVSLDDRLAGTT